MAIEAGARAAGAGLFTAAEINAAIAASPRINAHGMAQAQKAQGIWQGFVPNFDPSRSRRESTPHPEAGTAKDAVRVSVIRKLGRVAWRVGSSHYTARWMEFGAKHMPKIAPREKTIAAMKGGS